MSATIEPTATDRIAEAEEALIAAESALETLSDRMASGGKVSSTDWQRAEAEVRFATARRDAAMQAAEHQAEQERRDRVEQFRQSIPARLAVASLETAREQLAAALDAWVETCAGYDRAFSEVWGEILAAPNGPVAGVSSPGSGQIVADGRTYRNASTQSTIRNLAGAAIAKHYGPRRQIRLDQPQD